MNQQTQKKFQIVVGSTTGIKINATSRAVFAVGWLDAAVFGEGAPSDVPNQPIGNDEATTGARNRAHAIHRKYPEAVAVGIESGALIHKDEPDGSRSYLDRARIVVILPGFAGDGPTELHGYSEDLPVPQSVGDRVMACADRTLTIGMALALEHPTAGVNHQDPHSFLTDGQRSRGDYIADALSRFFQAHKAQIESSVKERFDFTNGEEPFFFVKLDGDAAMRLPVRELKKGNEVKPIAYFDLQGRKALDTDANRRLTALLATKTPRHEGLTVVVVPEGKSILAAGRYAETVGAQLIVLRKKDRFEASVENRPCASVTTPDGQRLHLYADDVELLHAADTVIIFDDVASKGETMFACRKIVAARGKPNARVLIAAILQEGTPIPGMYDPEKLIHLGKLPFPVPTDKIRHR